MQSYDDFRLIPTKQLISAREACGAYTRFATETADLAITAAKPTKNSEGTRIAASPFTVMDTYSALWLINAIIVLRLKFNIQRLKHVLEGDVY